MQDRPRKVAMVTNAFRQKFFLIHFLDNHLPNRLWNQRLFYTYWIQNIGPEGLGQIHIWFNSLTGMMVDDTHLGSPPPLPQPSPNNRTLLVATRDNPSGCSLCIKMSLSMSRDCLCTGPALPSLMNKTETGGRTLWQTGIQLEAQEASWIGSYHPPLRLERSLSFVLINYIFG